MPNNKLERSNMSSKVCLTSHLQIMMVFEHMRSCHIMLVYHSSQALMLLESLKFVPLLFVPDAVVVQALSVTRRDINVIINV